MNINLLLKEMFKTFVFLTQIPRIIFYRVLSYGKVDGNAKLRQPLYVAGKGVVCFGKNVSIGVFPSPYYWSTYSYMEARGANAKIFIDDGTSINNGFVAIAEHTSISIGKNVLIGTNVEIIDSDFHGLEVEKRSESDPDKSKAVRVSNDVFLGSNVKVCKGVTIGEGAVIANGSCVIRDVPAFCIAGGNPAKIVGQIKRNE